jgi:hypothetical protein
MRTCGGPLQELILITTLTDASVWPPEAVAALFLRRWEIEVHFDDLKTTLGMDSLRGRTPAITLRENWPCTATPITVCACSCGGRRRPRERAVPGCIVRDSGFQQPGP